MATATVSASVNADVKRIVGLRLSESGLTPNELIRSLWEHIALTGSIPSFDDALQQDARGAEEPPLFSQLMSLRAQVHAPEEFTELGRDDVRRLLEERDV